MLRVVLLLLATSVAWAGERICPGGALPAQTAIGASTDTIRPTHTNALIVQAIRTAGTGTVILEISCNGTAWAKVAGSDMAVDGTTTSLATSVTSPACLYRTNVTACSACNIAVQYACS